MLHLPVALARPHHPLEEESRMPRCPSLVVVVLALAVVGLVGTGHLPAVVAQSGTPMAEGMPPGVSAQPLGLGHVETLPAAPADLLLIRFTLAPGASVPIDPNDPSLTVASIESGTLTMRFDGPMTVTRASAMTAMATPGAMGMPATEQIPAGTTATLHAGDSVISPPNVGGILSNAGTEPVVVLNAIISPSAMGTPVATPAT
jgi:quercetin dioxygenase-like cupin family protein